MELITPDEKGKAFLYQYIKLAGEGKQINRLELDKLAKDLYEQNHHWRREIMEIYGELIKQDNNALRDFLNAGAAELLLHIGEIEEYRRAIAST